MQPRVTKVLTRGLYGRKNGFMSPRIPARDWNPDEGKGEPGPGLPGDLRNLAYSAASSCGDPFGDLFGGDDEIPIFDMLYACLVQAYLT
jgi:hypothetical protein